MTSAINPIGLNDAIKTKVHGINRKATALIAAAGITLSAASGLAVSDYMNASNIYKQIEGLKTGLIEGGLDQNTIAVASKTIDEGIEKNCNWYDSMTQRAVKKLIAWETSIGAWAVRNAYVEGLIEGLSGKSLDLNRAPEEIKPQKSLPDAKIIDVKAINNKSNKLDKTI